MQDLILGIAIGIFALLIISIIGVTMSARPPLSNSQIIEMIQECEKFKSADIKFHTYDEKIVRIECTMEVVKE